MSMANIAQADPRERESVRPCSEAGQLSAEEAAFAELEAGVGLALESYSNVHRGTGFNSMASTLLYERARNEVLSFSGLDGSRYTAIFCTPARASVIEEAVRPARPVVLSSRDLGLPLGLRAVIVDSRALPKGVPFQTGGGTVRIVSRRSVVWESAPDRFEAGTPPVINAVAFARGLELARRFGIRSFQPAARESATPHEILRHDDLEEFTGRELLLRLKRTTMGRGRPVPTSGGLLPYIHLDNAASTPTFRPVWEAVRQAWRLPEDGRAELTAAVRALCAGFFGAPADDYDVIFTSNTTEAINLAAKALTQDFPPLEKGGFGGGFCSRDLPPRRDGESETVVLNTIAEHNSNELPWRFAEGVTQVRIPVDGEGFPDLVEMERLLREYNEDRVHGRKRIRVVAVTGASNVLGTCPDLAEISRLAHRYGALAFVDAAQLAAHRAIRMAADGIDGLAFSGHKMYAPFGTGGLILRKGLRPVEDAAFEAARESGDENVAGIAALGKAIVLLERIGMDVVREEEMRLTRLALRELASVPGLRLFGMAVPDSPRVGRRLGVFSFELKHVPFNLAAEDLAETAGIGVRAGCHCAHLLVKRLLRIPPVREVLADFGLRLAPRITQSFLPGVVRVSIGLENDEADIRRLALALEKISARRQSLVTRLLAKTHNAAPALPDTGTRRRMRAAAAREVSSVYGAAPAGLTDDLSRTPDRMGWNPSGGMMIFGRPCCRKFLN